MIKKENCQLFQLDITSNLGIELSFLHSMEVDDNLPTTAKKKKKLKSISSKNIKCQQSYHQYYRCVTIVFSLENTKNWKIISEFFQI